MRRALTAIVSLAVLIAMGIGIWAQAAPGDAAGAATVLTARTVEAGPDGRPTNRAVRAQVTVWRVSATGNRSVRTVQSSGGTAVLGNLPAGVYFAGAVPATGHEPFNDDDAHPGYGGLEAPCQDLRACVLFTIDAQGGMRIVYQHGVEPTDGDLDFLFRPSPPATTAPPRTAGGSSGTSVTPTPATPATPARPAATKRIIVSVADTTPGSTNRWVKGADVLISDPSANRVPQAGHNVHYAPTNDRGLAMVGVHPSRWSVYVTLPPGYVFDGDPATKVVTVTADGGPVFGVGFRARRVSTSTTVPSAGTPDPQPRSEVTPPGGSSATPSTTAPSETTPTTTPVEPVPQEETPEEDDGVVYPYPEGKNPFPTPRPGDIELDLDH